MSLFTQRVLFKSGETISDLSVAMNDFLSGTAVIDVTTSDYIYVGSDLPFNHKHFDISVANAIASVVSVDIWYSGAWHDAVDVVDETAISGKSLAQSGRIQFSPDIQKGWSCEQYSEDVTGLDGTNIYNMYWVRFSWSANLTETTALKFVGEKFAGDNDMFTLYPMLNNSALMAKWKSGKTDWNDQHFFAARGIVNDLKDRRIVISEHQILDSSKFYTAAIHKAANIIFHGIQGEDALAKAQIASNRYEKAMKMDNYLIDLNADAKPSAFEKVVTSGVLYR